MTRQDEKQRLRRRLQEYAMNLAVSGRWDESVEVNQRILTSLGEDTETYNRLGRSYVGQGKFHEAYAAYQSTLKLNPTNTIARKKLACLESLLDRGGDQVAAEQHLYQPIDLRLFVTEAGRTALATLVDVPRSAAVESISPGDRVELQVEDRGVRVLDFKGNLLGYLDPKLGQRLSELITGGNRYIAAVAQSDQRQIRLILREAYQDPNQHGRISFPDKLGGSAMYGQILQYDYETEELLEEEDVSSDEHDDLETDYAVTDEEEDVLRLDTIEKDMDDEENEE